MLNDFENKLFNINNEITQKLFSSAELLNKIFFELKEKSLIQHYQVWLPDFII
jgi:hypothetical protein